jgi:hypothetical protein
MRDEAESALRDAVHAEDRCEGSEEHVRAIIAALTAPPEKPKVDVRKVWARVMREAKVLDRQPDAKMLAKALLPEGVEVME